MPIIRSLKKNSEKEKKSVTIRTVARPFEELKEWKEALIDWSNIQYNKEERIRAFEKILEDVLGCEKIKETDRSELYKCTFTITSKDVPYLNKPKIHSFDVFISKTTGKAIVEKGNLPEPLPVIEPLDLLNAYYITVEWNKYRDESIWLWGKETFEEHINEAWNYFKRKLEEEGIPVTFLERKRKGITRMLPERVLKTVAEKTRKTEKEIVSLLINIPKEVEQEYKRKMGGTTLEELFKGLKF